MRGRKGSGNIQYNDLFSSTPKRVLQLSHSNACGSQLRHGHIPVSGLLFMFARLLLVRSAYKSPTKNNFTSLMKSRNVVTLPDVMLTSHSIPQACWNVIIEHPFWVLLNKSLYCMFPDSFLPRVAVRVGEGPRYARLPDLFLPPTPIYNGKVKSRPRQTRFYHVNW